MTDTLYCAICDEPLPDMYAVKWTVDPWGKVYDYAHKTCADDWEPTDEQMCPSEPGPSLQEQYERAWELKRSLK